MFPLLNLKTNNIFFFLNPTNIDEIIKITKNLKASSSSRIENISTKLLKVIINEIAPALSHILNRSLLSGSVPSQLRNDKVNSIFKSGDNQVFSNYRPNSILPSISKSLEKNYAYPHLWFCYWNEILSPHQYGFRPNRSTYMAKMTLIAK